MLDKNFEQLTKTQIDEAVAKRTQLYENRRRAYDKSAKDLPPLHLGQNVRVFNPITSQWDTKATVIVCDQACGRSYRVETQNGNLLWRNRRFLRPFNQPGRLRGRLQR